MKDVEIKTKTAIVIPLDGSQTAAKAFGTAQALANIMDGELHIAHVKEEPPYDELIDLHSLIKKNGVGNHVLHQATGEVVESVLKIAVNVSAKIIVMASHGFTYNADNLLGGKAMGMIMNSPIPVLVVRPDIRNLPAKEWRPARMLVPLNGSPLAAASMKTVFELADLMGTDIDVLHVAVLGTLPSEAGTLASPRYLDYPQYDWPAWAEEFIERFCKYQPPGVELRLFHRKGELSEEIMKFASKNDEDVIILSWSGRLGKRRAKTVQQILRATDLPVLLVRSPR